MNERGRLGLVGLMLVSAVACGDDDGADPNGSGGTPATGGETNTGGAMTGGNMGSGGNLPTGGVMTGGVVTGGVMTGGMMTAGSVSLDDVDLTLSGLNQDLAAPTVDCLGREGLQSGCMTVSGEYNGSTFESTARKTNWASFLAAPAACSVAATPRTGRSSWRCRSSPLSSRRAPPPLCTTRRAPATW